MKKIVPILLIQLGLLFQVAVAQNAPVSAIGSVVTFGTTAVVPITLNDISIVHLCDLVVTYDPAIATNPVVTKDPAVDAMYFIDAYPEPGVITIAWLSFSTLPSTPDLVFATIAFDKVTDGYSAIEFDNSLPDNCQWGTFPPPTDLNDTPESDYYFNGSVTFASEGTLWTGDVDDSWSDDLNWTSGVPGATSIAIINDVSPNLFPSANTSSECLGLDIAPGANVTILATSSLTVYGDVINNGQFTVESTVAGDGSFINHGTITGTGSFKVKRYLTEDEWHYVSSPIGDAISGAFLGIWLRPFDEATYSWGDYITATDENLLVMKGYAAWAADPSVVSFDGPVNSGSQIINVTNTTPNPGAFSGYNLVGNPYPSAVDWSLTDGWDKTNVDNTIYFWKGVGGPSGSGNYYYYNGGGGDVPGVGLGYGIASQFIPAMQGFFVRATADGTFGVNNDARVHNGQAFYKGSEKNTLPLIRLRAQNADSLFDETIIRFYSGATAEHDGDYDAFKLQGYMLPVLYSITPEQASLAINTYPTCENGTVIPLGFESPEEGEYSISLDKFENFEPGMVLYLEDVLNDNMVNLSLNPEYAFSSTPDDIKERFNLHFGDLVGVPETQSDAVYIYSFDNIIKVRNPENVKGEITVYNLTGQEIARTKADGSSQFEIMLNSGAGYFLVKFQSEGYSVAKKVFIK